MPIYEYRCEACGEVAEVIQKISDAPLTTCPGCGQGPVAKLISRTSFQLKGTGWYATDYKKSTASPAPSTKSEPSAAPAEKKTETPEKTQSGDKKQKTRGPEK